MGTEGAGMATGRRIKKSERELEGIAHEVQYEVDMMRNAARLLRSARDRVHRTFYLELFLLHLRNMREFLYCTSTNPDDVAAEDFISPDDWSSIRPPLGPKISKERERLNRALAHLSYSRLIYNKTGKGWYVETMRGEIEGTLETFFRAIPPGWKKWFRSAYFRAGLTEGR